MPVFVATHAVMAVLQTKLPIKISAYLVKYLGSPVERTSLQEAILPSISTVALHTVLIQLMGGQ